MLEKTSKTAEAMPEIAVGIESIPFKILLRMAEKTSKTAEGLPEIAIGIESIAFKILLRIPEKLLKIAEAILLKFVIETDPVIEPDLTFSPV